MKNFTRLRLTRSNAYLFIWNAQEEILSWSHLCQLTIILGTSRRPSNVHRQWKALKTNGHFAQTNRYNMIAKTKMRRISSILLLSDDYITWEAELRTVWRKLPKLTFNCSATSIFPNCDKTIGYLKSADQTSSENPWRETEAKIKSGHPNRQLGFKGHER